MGTRYAKRRMCAAHGRELVGELCLHSRLIMAAAGDGQPYQLCRAQRLTPTVQGGLLQSLACGPMQSAFGGGASAG